MKRVTSYVICAAVIVSVACGSTTQDKSNGSGASGGSTASGGSSAGSPASGGNSAGGSTATAGSGGGLGSNPTASEITVALITASCEKRFLCCSTAAIAGQFSMHPSVPTDVAGCVDLLVERGAAFRVQDAVDAVANGNVRFHPEYADACVAAVNASSCAQWGPSFGIYGGTSPWEPCQNMVEGLVADGQACSNRFECVSGDCVSSICIARGSLGDSCGTEPYYLCKSGLGCMGTPPTCQPQHASGEACTLASDCLARECDIPTQTCVWDCEMP